jgi:hypothetical protein
VVVNQREVCQKLGALPYVQTIDEKYVKLHEHHYLTYIHMTELLMSQNSMQTTYPVLVHKPIQYDKHTICVVEIFVVQLAH